MSSHHLGNWQVGPPSRRHLESQLWGVVSLPLTISHSRNNIYTSYQTPLAGCSLTEIDRQTLIQLKIQFQTNRRFHNFVWKVSTFKCISLPLLWESMISQVDWNLCKCPLERAVSKAYGGNSQLICLTPTMPWQCPRKKCINDRKSRRKTWELKDCFSSPFNDQAHAIQIWNHRGNNQSSRRSRRL